jgi:hypothetical protein
MGERDLPGSEDPHGVRVAAARARLKADRKLGLVPDRRLVELVRDADAARGTGKDGGSRG